MKKALHYLTEKCTVEITRENFYYTFFFSIFIIPFFGTKEDVPNGTFGEQGGGRNGRREPVSGVYKNGKLKRKVKKNQ